MKLITRQSLADGALARWESQYSGLYAKWPEKKLIADALAGLPSPINPDAVDEIIGNRSWTMPHDCDECRRNFDYIVEVGQKPDYESNTAYLCRECLGKAFDLTGPISR